MTEFVSEVKTIPFNEDRIFNMLSDLSNLGKVQDRIPQDKIQDFEFDKDSCSFSVAPVGKITFQIVERRTEQDDQIHDHELACSPVPLDSAKTGRRERHTDENNRPRRTESVYQTNGIKTIAGCDR